MAGYAAKTLCTKRAALRHFVSWRRRLKRRTAGPDESEVTEFMASACRLGPKHRCLASTALSAFLQHLRHRKMIATSAPETSGDGQSLVLTKALRRVPPQRERVGGAITPGLFAVGSPTAPLLGEAARCINSLRRARRQCLACFSFRACAGSIQRVCPIAGHQPAVLFAISSRAGRDPPRSDRCDSNGAPMGSARCSQKADALRRLTAYWLRRIGPLQPVAVIMRSCSCWRDWDFDPAKSFRSNWGTSAGGQVRC